MKYKDNSFGLKILEERNLRGLSQEQLAKMAVITVRRIESYESGEVKPNSASFNAIMKAFEKFDKEKEKEKEDKDRNQPNFSGQSFDNGVYRKCFDDLFDGCNELRNYLFKHNVIDEKALGIATNYIYRNSNSLELQVKNSIVSSTGIDKYLSVYTIKSCLKSLIDSYNYLYAADRFCTVAKKSSIVDKETLGHFMVEVRSSIHNLKFIIDYINEFFLEEFETVLLVAKPNGTLYSIFDLGMLSYMLKNNEKIKVV